MNQKEVTEETDHIRKIHTILDLQNLSAGVNGREILRNVDLHINRGETVVLFGPNGSGKTSLLKTIVGFPDLTLKGGTIFFKGENITHLPIDERAQRGIGIAFQRPPAVRGVKLKDILDMCMKKRKNAPHEDITRVSDKLHLLPFLERDINLGFSGGEIKRSELLQLRAQGPDLMLFDEPDSGVDLVSIKLVGNVINELLEKGKRADERARAGLIITHSGYILDYVNADRAYVLMDGTIACSGNPRDVLDDIRTKGFDGCIRCRQ